MTRQLSGCIKTDNVAGSLVTLQNCGRYPVSNIVLSVDERPVEVQRSDGSYSIVADAVLQPDQAATLVVDFTNVEKGRHNLRVQATDATDALRFEWNGDCSPQGEWIIPAFTTVHCRNKAIFMNGNISVHGTLRLFRVNITMNNTGSYRTNATIDQAGPFIGYGLVKIEVYGNGALFADRSTFTSAVPPANPGDMRDNRSMGYNFFVDDGAQFSLTNNQIDFVGWDDMNRTENMSGWITRNKGLWIDTPNALFENNTVWSLYRQHTYALYFGKDGNVIKGNMIRTHQENGFGIVLNDSSYNIIANNTFHQKASRKNEDALVFMNNSDHNLVINNSIYAEGEASDAVIFDENSYNTGNVIVDNFMRSNYSSCVFVRNASTGTNFFTSNLCNATNYSTSYTRNITFQDNTSVSGNDNFVFQWYFSLRVLNSGAPVPGATVVISGEPGGPLSLQTDANGYIPRQNLTDFIAHAIVNPAPPPDSLAEYLEYSSHTITINGQPWPNPFIMKQDIDAVVDIAP